MFLRRQYSTEEIRSGLVMFVSPAAIAIAEETTASTAAFEVWRTMEPHYVLVLETDGDVAAITPLSSHPRGAGWLPVTGKLGHSAGWVAPTTVFHPGQVWPVRKSTLIDAARRGNDLTQAGNRNRVTGKGLGHVVAQVWRWRSYRFPGSSLLTPEVMWRAYWASYRTGEIWSELRMSSVVLAARRVRFVTGGDVHP